MAGLIASAHVHPIVYGMHAGETIAVRVKASTHAGSVVREGTVVAEFWAPGRDPRADPAVRDSPDHSAPCTFDGHSAWVAAGVPTEGWPPGAWTVRGRVAGVTGPGTTARGWGWQSFQLAA